MDARGWVPATAGNISVRLDCYIAITRSGGHKGFLDAGSVIEVDLDGVPLRAGDRPSAETLLHCQIYRHHLQAGVVLHGHSVAATVLSMLGSGSITFVGYEVLKVFEGQSTHQAALELPVFDNDQDIARLAATIEPFMASGCPMGTLIRGHGVYVWGPDIEVAMARLEGLEFLLACELERRKLQR